MKVREQQVMKIKIEAMQCYGLYRLVQNRLMNSQRVSGEMLCKALPAKERFNELMTELKRLDPQFPTQLL